MGGGVVVGQLLSDYIVIQPHEPKAGLVLPDGYGESGYGLGVVLAVGPGRVSEHTGDLIPMPDLKAGDVVYYAKGGGTPGEWGEMDNGQPRRVRFFQASRNDVLIRFRGEA